MSIHSIVWESTNVVDAEGQGTEREVMMAIRDEISVSVAGCLASPLI